MATFRTCFRDYELSFHVTKRVDQKVKRIGWFSWLHGVHIQLSQIYRHLKDELSEDDDNCFICYIIEVINHEHLHMAIHEARHFWNSNNSNDYFSIDIPEGQEEEMVEELNSELLEQAENSLD